MCKNLNKTTSSEENKAQVNIIKDRLANLMKEFKSNQQVMQKKLKTEITCGIWWNLLSSLTN